MSSTIPVRYFLFGTLLLPKLRINISLYFIIIITFSSGKHEHSQLPA